MNRHIIFKTERFNNIRSLLDTCDAREVNAWAKTENRSQRASWAGESYDEARELLTHGASDDVKKLTPKKLKQAESIKPRAGRDFAGYAPIVPRAIQGLPRDMKRKKPVRVPSRVITLVIDIGYAGGNDADEIARRGRELCELIQGAELAGYRVALDVFFSVQREKPYDWEAKHKEAYTVRLNIKRAEQPLDIKHVCYPLIHASMLRQIFFDWYERYPNAEKYDGHGTCLFAQSQQWREFVFSKVLKNGEQYVDLMKSDFDSIL